VVFDFWKIYLPPQCKLYTYGKMCFLGSGKFTEDMFEKGKAPLPLYGFS